MPCGGCFAGLRKKGSASRHSNAAPKCHTAAPVSTLRLVATHPHLVSCGTVSHPIQLVHLLHHAQVGPLQAFCDRCPADVLGKALPELLKGLDTYHIINVLAPLLNTPRLHEALVTMLVKFDAALNVRILTGVKPGKLDVLLQAPPSALAALVAHVENDRIDDMLVPVNACPEAVLGLLTHMTKPKRPGILINYLEIEVLVWMIGEIDPNRLAIVMDLFKSKDYAPDGCFVVFLKELEGERKLSKQKVAPFVEIIDSAMLVQLVQHVSPDKLLEVLRRVGPEGVARILDSANLDLIIRLWNGPLEQTVTAFAGGLSELGRNSMAATTVKGITDGLNNGVSAVETNVARGKLLRGASRRADYVFGDYTRGLFASLFNEDVPLPNRQSADMSPTSPASPIQPNSRPRTLRKARSKSL